MSHVLRLICIPDILHIMAKRTPSSQGKRNRQVGQSTERELGAFLQQYWPKAARGIQTRKGGQEASDLEGTPIFWEVKHRASHACLRFLEQAEKDADLKGDDRPCAVALREAGRRRFAVLMWLDETPEFLSLFQEASNGEA